MGNLLALIYRSISQYTNRESFIHNHDNNEDQEKQIRRNDRSWMKCTYVSVRDPSCTLDTNKDLRWHHERYAKVSLACYKYFSNPTCNTHSNMQNYGEWWTEDFFSLWICSWWEISCTCEPWRIGEIYMVNMLFMLFLC